MREEFLESYPDFAAKLWTQNNFKSINLEDIHDFDDLENLKD